MSAGPVETLHYSFLQPSVDVAGKPLFLIVKNLHIRFHTFHYPLISTDH